VLEENKIQAVKAIDLGITVAEMSGREHIAWQDYQTIGKETLEAIKYGKA
jgi:chromosome partitioning protein